MRAFGFIAASGIALLSACQVIGGFESFEKGDGTGGVAGGTGGSGGKGGASGSGGAESGGSSGSAGAGGAETGGGGGGGAGGGAPVGCTGTDPGKHGPKMAAWQRPDGTCFWIDTTEVTNAEYDEFVAEPKKPPQTAVCTGNTFFYSTCGGDSAVPVPTQPVTCIDWCDAAAFCAWAGKTLCSDTTVQTDFNKPQASDWYAVCSSNGTNGYPYGRSQSADACATSGSPNGCPDGTCSLADVGSYSECKVAAKNGDVFDLVGNVAEWTDACSPNTATGNCNTRGGFYGSNDSCQAGVNRVSRQQRSETVGFRCCAAAETAADGG